MKAIKLALGLAVVATAIVGVATPAYALTSNCPYVGVTMHLVDKLTGEKIAEDVHIYQQSIRSTPNSENGDAVYLELPYVAGYNALGNGSLGVNGKANIVYVPYNTTEVSTTVSYEKAVGTNTQTSKIGWYQLSGSWYYNNSNGQMKTGWIKDGWDWYYLGVSGKMKTGWVN